MAASSETEQNSLAVWGVDSRPLPAQFVFDAETDKKDYCRALKSEKEIKELDKEEKFTIEHIRAAVAQNLIKQTVDSKGEIIALDPEVLMSLDIRIQDPIFVTDDNVYTREELLRFFPFAELQTIPEAVFTQQEIGVFPAKRFAMDAKALEYVARDAGDETIAFVMIEDMVGKATRQNYKEQRKPLKIVKTKIFLGKERWNDFSLLRRFVRGILNVNGGRRDGPLLAALLPATSSGRLMIANDEIEMREREAAAKRREEEAQRLEAEARRREEEARRREEENRRIEARIAEDLRRIESYLPLFDKAGGGPTRPYRSEDVKVAVPHRAADAPPAESSPAAPPPEASSAADDSVEL